MRKQIRCGVYHIINEVNGKSYVGSSVDVDNRWSAHRRDSKDQNFPHRSLLYPAIRKHGIENFTFVLLEQCERVKELLLEREQHYIDILKPEYNLMPKAGSRLGSKASPEQIAAQSERMKARIGTPEWEAQLARMAGAAKEYMNDPDVKEAYRELRQGKTFEEIMGEEKAAIARAKQVEAKANAEIKCHAAGWNKGIPADPAHIQRMVDARDGMEVWNKGTTGLMPEPWNKGVEPTPEMLAQLIEVGFQPGMEPWNKGMIMSDEHCQRMSKTAKEHFDPDHQAMITEAARVANSGRKYSQEHCDAISEGNLNSAARKAFAESRRGVARSDELKQKVSEGIISSAKFQASVQRRVGKKRADNTSGHYGIVWDKAREKWIARANKKSKRFATIEEAIQWRDEILAAA